MNTQYPLLWSAICLMAGILLFDEFPAVLTSEIMVTLIIGGFFVLSVFCLWKGKKLFLLPCLALLCILGMGRMYLADQSFQNLSSWAVGSEGTWTGIIREAPMVQRGKDPYVRYFTEIESITYKDGVKKEISGTAFVYETDPKTIYRTGDRISFNGELKAIRIYKNPGKIDLEGRYRSRRILGRIYPEKTETLHFMGDSGKFQIRRWSEDRKEQVEQSFAPYMDPVRLHILMTLLFGGDYNEIPESIMTSFSATGIVHILSVSGSHVALLFGFLYFIGKWLHLPSKMVITGSIFLVLFYSVLSGLVPPVIRAAVMGILSVCGVFLDRGRTSLNLLGTAVTGMLLWDPFYLYDVSFQLSVGASAGILLFYRPILETLHKIPHMPSWVNEGISLSIAAQVLTIPLMLYDFHRFPLFFIPANLFVTPLLEWVIIGGLLAALVSLIFMPLAGGILYLSDYFLWMGLRFNMKLSALPGSMLQTGGMTISQMIFYYLTVGMFYFKKYLWTVPKRRVAVIFSWTFSLASVIYFYIIAPDTAVYAPDLGPDQGAVVVTKNHKILYYRGSRIPSHTSNWEWNSLLGYEGIFDADILILNLEDTVEPIPLTLALPVKEIWVTGGDVKQTAPHVLENFHGKIRNLTNSVLKMGNLSFLTNGSSWLIEKDDRGIYFSGKKGLSIASYPEHTLWIASDRKKENGISEKEADDVHAEAIIYGGSRLTSSYEDMELFDYKNYNAVNLYRDGMQTAVFKNTWELEGNNVWPFRM